MEVMDKWVDEFVLRRQQNHRVHAPTLSSALKSDDCVRAKITAVLRDMLNSLIRGRVDEEMLDLLEILERLQEDSVIMGSLKSAYCWTAVECTLRFMWPVTASDGFFSEALERIWGKRVGVLKERESHLVTRELLKWESDLKMALEKPEMYHKIRETNIRYNAISHLNQLLEEHWALFGCDSLESEARRRFLQRKGQRGESLGRAGDGQGRNENSGEDVEDEPLLTKGDITVAGELKGFLLGIQGLVGPFTWQGQETNDNHSVDVSRQPDQTKGTETGGGGQADGSQGTSCRRVRPRLPTPEPLNVSPLNKGKSTKTLPRRLNKFWTPEQVEALRDGVKEYGKAWKHIKDSNPLVFTNKTQVDLKDKWRNLIGRY